MTRVVIRPDETLAKYGDLDYGTPVGGILLFLWIFFCQRLRPNFSIPDPPGPVVYVSDEIEPRHVVARTSGFWKIFRTKKNPLQTRRTRTLKYKTYRLPPGRVRLSFASRPVKIETFCARARVSCRLCELPCGTRCRPPPPRVSFLLARTVVVVDLETSVRSRHFHETLFLPPPNTTRARVVLPPTHLARRPASVIVQTHRGDPQVAGAGGGRRRPPKRTRRGHTTTLKSAFTKLHAITRRSSNSRRPRARFVSSFFLRSRRKKKVFLFTLHAHAHTPCSRRREVKRYACLKNKKKNPLFFHLVVVG